MEHGEPCVMTFGDMKMLVWSVANLDSQDMVTTIIVVMIARSHYV